MRRLTLTSFAVLTVLGFLATGRASACRKHGMRIVAVLSSPSPSPSPAQT